MSELEHNRPLLANGNVEDATETGKPQDTFRFREKYLLFIIYFTVFLFLCGENIQPAPRTQVYEVIICRYQHSDGTIALNDNICKGQDVQEELAFLEGMERLLGALPTILAIPYSFLSDKYGRPLILTLAFIGLFLEESWIFLVCWFSSFIPLRLVLLAPLFEIIGGGGTIIITMFYVIVSDAVSIEHRTSAFFVIRGTGIAAAIVARVTGSLLMGLNIWIPWFVGLVMLLAAAAVATIVPNLPRSHVEVETRLPDAEVHTVTETLASKLKESNTIQAQLKDIFKHLKAGVYVIFGNLQVMLLLGITFLAQLGESSLAMILLLYISKRFAWDFAKANLIWALGETVQFLFLIVLLPYLSSILLSRYHLSVYAKDFRIVIPSIIALSTGCLLIGFGTQIWLAFIGVILISTAGGMESLLRSLITTNISARDISIVYSVFTILHVLSSSLAGPLYSITFTIGLRLGTPWAGLPFVVAGSLAALALCGLMFVKESHQYDQVPADDLDT